MFFLSDSERHQLRALLLEKAKEYATDHTAGMRHAVDLDARHLESDAHLVFEGLHVLAGGIAARLYAMLHAHGHRSHPGANGGRTLLMMQKIEEGGVPTAIPQIFHEPGFHHDHRSHCCASRRSSHSKLGSGRA